MPPWLLFTLFVLGCTLIAPLFVLGMTSGNWREALRVWRTFCIWLGALALPGALLWLWLQAFPFRP